MNRCTRFVLSGILVAGITVLSCSGEKPPVITTQYTDPTNVTGIVLYQGAVYCSTKGGLVKWEIPEGKYTVYTTADGLFTNILNDIAVDGDNRIWVSSDEGLDMFDGTSWKHYTVSHGLPSIEVTDLSVDNEGKLWIGTADGVASFEGGSFKLLDEESGPGRQPVTHIYFDFGNNIWVGTAENGLYYNIEGSWHISNTRDGLPENTVFTITQSWDLSMWSASRVGMSKWSGSGWNFFSSLDQLGTFHARFFSSTEN